MMSLDDSLEGHVIRVESVALSFSLRNQGNRLGGLAVPRHIERRGLFERKSIGGIISDPEG